MCLQCLVHPYYFGEVVPGWHLIRARKDDYKDNPKEMKAGDFGLVVCNDPSFIWSSFPKEIPDDSALDEEFDAFYNEVEEFENKVLSMGVRGVLSLVESCRKVGFSEEEHDFAEWFYNYIAKYIKTCKIEEDTDGELVKDNPIKLFDPLGIV